MLSHVAIIELELDQALTVPMLLELADRGRAAGVLGPELEMPTEAGPYMVTREAARILGDTGLAARQVGSIEAGKVTFWRSVEKHYFDWAIMRGVSSTGALHSLLCDRHLFWCYNPWPGLRIVSRPRYLLYQVVSPAP